MIYRHSGSLGDIIYALPVIKKLGRGELQIPIDNLANVCKRFGYDVRAMHKEHHGCMTDNSVNLLRPLLEAQPYITQVSVRPPNFPVDVDLDDFRRVIFRSCHGNYLQSYMQAFKLDYTESDATMPWMEVESKPQAPYIVCRTPRYITDEPQASRRWTELSLKYNFEKNALFVGNTYEHEEFEKNTGTKIRYYPVTDFYQLAQVIRGCARFFGNQTFAYSLAIALGRPASLETQKSKPLHRNECYFEKRNVTYF